MAEIFLILLTLPLYECCAAEKSFQVEKIQLHPLKSVEVSGSLSFELNTIPPNHKSEFDSYKTTRSPTGKTEVSEIPAENQLMMERCDDAEITGVIFGCNLVSFKKIVKLTPKYTVTKIHLHVFYFIYFLGGQKLQGTFSCKM